MKKKIIVIAAGGLVILGLGGFLLYLIRESPPEPAGVKRPDPLFLPHTARGVDITHYYRGRTISIRAAMMRPNPPRPEHFLTFFQQMGYKIHLRQVKIVLKEGEKRLEIEAVEAFANEDLTRLKLTKITRINEEGQRAYGLSPGLTEIRITISDQQARVEG